MLKILNKNRYMRNIPLLIIVVHILLYFSVITDFPVLRQCIGFMYLTFIPGFVILGAIGIRTVSLVVKTFLSVCLSVAFVMFVGLLINSIYPLFGISAPLSTFPLMITISILTFVTFVFSQRKVFENKSDINSLFFHKKINNEGAVLCTISLLILVLSIVGAICHSVFMLVSVVAGISAVFIVSIFLNKRIPSSYQVFVLFIISLSLLLQTSLISQNLMGWDIFNEYAVFESVRTVGFWDSPGIGLNVDVISNLRSILSITILPTVYSSILNLDGELVYKIIYPFLFSFVPVILFKTYETQLGKVIALFSVFFFIADPINWYGLESLSLAREMITYLFLTATIFCFVAKDLDQKYRRILILIFSVGIAVSHYSLAFLSVFLIIVVFVAMRLTGRKDQLLNLRLVLLIVIFTFAWYMFVATSPLNTLEIKFNNIASNFATDLFNADSRLSSNVMALSPTSQTMSLNGLIHKIVVYISEFFVAIGVIILIIKPKEFKFCQIYRWIAIFAAVLLLSCIAVPNFAPALNFTRFYRYAMVFLAPLFVLGGLYIFRLLGKVTKKSIAPPKLIFGVLIVILLVFFFYRSGFVNTITGDLPTSVALDFDRMKNPEYYKVGMSSQLEVYVPEQDLLGTRWLVLHMENGSSVYADSRYHLGIALLSGENLPAVNNELYYIRNDTQIVSRSYIYLSTFNFQMNTVIGNGNLSDYSSMLSQGSKVYSSNGNDVYYVP